MLSLQKLIFKIQQAREDQDTYLLSILADQALEATLDEKLTKSEPQCLTNYLSEIINEFEKTDIRIDDLRYRLAHLYMRSRKWEEAENQLLEIKDYLQNEAQIYSALCTLKQLGEPLDKAQAEDKIQNNIKRIAQELCSNKHFKTKSIQEQHFNLLEMLVYAFNLDYSILGSYYQTGSTKADLKVRYFDHNLNINSGSLGEPIARFRLLKLLQHAKEKRFLIIDSTSGGFKELGNFTTFLNKPLIKKFAEILVDRFPNDIAISEILEKLKDEGLITNAERRQTGSELKRDFCDIFGESSISATDTHPTRYKLNHSFIVVKNRKGRNK